MRNVFYNGGNPINQISVSFLQQISILFCINHRRLDFPVYKGGMSQNIPLIDKVTPFYKIHKREYLWIYYV